MPDTINIDRQLVDDLRHEIAGLTATLRSMESRLAALVDDAPGPVLDAATAARVEAVGEAAHRHLAHLEEHGCLTLADSLLIRRKIYGNKIQSTANLFGRHGINSTEILWRDTPYGSPRRDSDPVGVTHEGRRIAQLWRELHPERL